jgi:GNAT superfamily N-acetyltransferase
MAAESPRFASIPYDDGHALAVVHSLIGAERGAVFVLERDGAAVGMLLGIAAPHLFSPQLLASDLALFILPTHRKGRAAVALIRAFEDWARRIGAVEVALGVSTGVHPEATVRLFERLGYVPVSYGTLKRMN